MLGKPSTLMPRYVCGPAAHFSLMVCAVPAPDVHRHQRARHGVEAGGEDDDVELVVGVGGADALRRDPLDRAVADVDERHVVAVERLVVGVPERRPLAAEGIALGAEQLGRLGVRRRSPRILFAEEFGRRLVRLLVDQEVVERLEQVLEPARLERRPRTPPAARRASRRRDVRLAGSMAKPNDVLLGHAPRSLVAVLDRLALAVGERMVVGGDHVVRRALEHREVGRLLGHDRDHLDGGGAGADDRRRACR